MRAREDARADLMRVRHRLSKLLLRQGRVYSAGTPGTACTRSGCASNVSTIPTPRAAFDRGPLRRGARRDGRRDRLDEQIVAVAASPRCADPVDRLGCLRGISALTGLALSVEIGDWTRFTVSSIGAYVGLVPASSPRAPHGFRGRSPRPATPTCGGCWSRPPGTTARYTLGRPARPMGRWPQRPSSWPCRQPATAPAVGGSSTARRIPWSQRRDRPRTARLVLVAGHVISKPAHQPCLSQFPDVGEVGEPICGKARSHNTIGARGRQCARL